MRTGRPKVALILTDDERPRRRDSLAHRSGSALTSHDGPASSWWAARGNRRTCEPARARAPRASSWPAILMPDPGTRLYTADDHRDGLGAVRPLHADLHPSVTDTCRAHVPARERVYTVLRPAIVPDELPAHQRATRAAFSGGIARCSRPPLSRASVGDQGTHAAMLTPRVTAAAAAWMAAARFETVKSRHRAEPGEPPWS
jgi:hypothetical protein